MLVSMLPVSPQSKLLILSPESPTASNRRKNYEVIVNQVKFPALGKGKKYEVQQSFNKRWVQESSREQVRYHCLED
jgi:hypothetical protein